MDWETASTNTLKDNSSNNNENNENQTNSIANAPIETITINNDEFQNLNTSNFDTNLNLNLTQLNQLINLNSNDDLIDANDNKNSFSDNDKSNLFEAHNNDNNMLDLGKLFTFELLFEFIVFPLKIIQTPKSNVYLLY